MTHPERSSEPTARQPAHPTDAEVLYSTLLQQIRASLTSVDNAALVDIHSGGAWQADDLGLPGFVDAKPSGSYRDQIAYIADRQGHDRRYALDTRKIERELGWRPAEKTVQRYQGNQGRVENVQSGEYLKWLDKNYSQPTGGKVLA